MTQDQKLHIAMYAAIHGTAAAIRAFKKEMPEVAHKESTAWTRRVSYQALSNVCKNVVVSQSVQISRIEEQRNGSAVES